MGQQAGGDAERGGRDGSGYECHGPAGIDGAFLEGPPPGERFQERALSGAALAQDHMERAPRHREGEILNGRRLSVLERDPFHLETDIPVAHLPPPTPLARAEDGALRLLLPTDSSPAISLKGLADLGR